MTPTSGVTSLPSPPTMRHVRALDANRAGPAGRSNQRHATCALREEVRCLVGGASHDERERLATDLDVACKITCTTALHYDDSHLSCRSSYFATEKTRAPAPTSCPRDCRCRRLAWLPTTTSSMLGSPSSAFAVALHHFCTGSRQSLTSWVPPTTKCSTRGTLPVYLSPRPLAGYGGFEHCTAQLEAHFGHTQTR